MEELFEYLEEALEEEECDHSLKNTEQWIIDNIDDEERRDQVRREIKEDGGYCDCEVLGNCYEESNRRTFFIMFYKFSRAIFIMLVKQV